MAERPSGTIEKAVALSRARVQLGRTPPAAVMPEVVDDIVAAPTPHPLEAALAASERRIVELESELERARAQCDRERQALDALQQSIETARAQAEKEGYEQGRQRGEQTAEEALREQAQLWQQGMAALADQQRALQTRLCDSLADLVLACATKIIGERLATVADARAALDFLIGQSGLGAPLTVRVAPRCHELLKNAAEEDIRWQYLPDATVEYGGAVLESDGIVVDGRYEVQLARLRAIIGTLDIEVVP